MNKVCGHCCIASVMSNCLRPHGHQAPLSLGFSRQKYWHRSPCPPPKDLPNPGIEPSLLGLLHWQVDSLPLVPPQFSSVTQSCPTLCDSMDCSTPGFPVHHQLLEPTQTHVCWVSDAIQPFHSLSSPSPPAFNLSQHQGLFQ